MGQCDMVHIWGSLGAYLAGLPLLAVSQWWFGYWGAVSCSPSSVIVLPTIHPTSSCSCGWRWVVLSVVPIVSFSPLLLINLCSCPPYHHLVSHCFLSSFRPPPQSLPVCPVILALSYPIFTVRAVTHGSGGECWLLAVSWPLMSWWLSLVSLVSWGSWLACLLRCCWSWFAAVLCILGVPVLVGQHCCCCCQLHTLMVHPMSRGS